MTTKEIFDSHKSEWIRWAVPMVFAAGMGWTLLKSVPIMQEKLQVHDTRLAVMETRLGNIDSGISDIKDALRGDRMQRGAERRFDLNARAEDRAWRGQ